MSERMLSHSDVIAQFCGAMRAAGLIVDASDIVTDSPKFQRCKSEKDKGARKNGYYKLWMDGRPAGVFGIWSTGESHTWAADTGTAPMCADEQARLRAEMRRKQAERAAEIKEAQNKAADRAKKIWEKAVPADDSHPYLARKGVSAHGLRVGKWWKWDSESGKPYVACENALLVPMYGLKRDIRSLQAIFPSKVEIYGDLRDKDYLSSGERSGVFHVIGKPQEIDGRKVAIVAEGYATASSIHEATGHCVLVAFDTGNLVHPAQVFRSKYPDAVIVFAADNDQFTVAPINNPGVYYARKAAAAVGGLVAIPQFDDLDGRPTDFNDLHQRGGAGAVAAWINASLYPPKAPEAHEQPNDGDQNAPTGEHGGADEHGAEGGAPASKVGAKARAAVAGLNERHAVVIVGDKTVVMMERQSARRGHGTEVLFMSVESFKLFYLNQTVWVDIVDKDGKDKSKFVPIANWWLQSPDRRQFEGITFKPDGTAPKGYYNMWHGHAVEPLPLGVFRNAMKCRRLLRHIKYNACRGNREHFHYLLAWMADLVQDPTVKKGVALVMRGRKGCGKSKIAEVLASLFGGHAIKIAQMKHLLGNFNRHLANKMLAVAEESFWAGNKADDGPLKDMVTSETVMLEAKGIDAVEMESYVRIVMITNNAWVVPASDDERRYFVLDVGDGRLQDNDYFAAIDEQMNRNGNEGRRALLSLLMSIDLSGVNLRKVPETDALREQRALSLEPHDQFIHDALVSGYIGEFDWEITRPISKQGLHDAYLMWIRKQGKSHPMDLARFCSHFSKRIDVTTERPRGKPWEKRERVFNLPRREEAAQQFGRAMKIDMSHVLEGSDSPIHD